MTSKKPSFKVEKKSTSTASSLTTSTSAGKKPALSLTKKAPSPTKLTRTGAKRISKDTQIDKYDRVTSTHSEAIRQRMQSLAEFGIKGFNPSYFYNPRFQAALLVKEVLEDKKSLVIDLEGIVDSKDIGFVSELAYGTLRYLPRLTTIANKLLTNSFPKHSYFAYYILLQALYQQIYMNKADHAVTFENVELTKKIYGNGISKIINACLRNFQRQEQELLKSTASVSLLPGWLRKLLEVRLPEEQAPQIIEAMTERPPFWIRVNQDKVSVETYCQALDQSGIAYQQHPHIPTALCLNEPQAVPSLPGYEAGWFVVQDLHAQIASLLLTQEIQAKTNPSANEDLASELELVPRLQTSASLRNKASNQDLLILDSCCSPGGKTTHLLDIFPQATMIANDIDALRLQRVYANLERCQQQAVVINADAREPEVWLEQALAQAGKPQAQSIDLMLLDIPCSGTGVIRRHPDIKWLRKPEDIIRLHDIQLAILENSWKYLAEQGRLLYTSCSILGQENEQVIKEFLEAHPEAKLVDMTAWFKQNIFPLSQGIEIDGPGVQLVNSNNSGDGFYYCLLVKQ